MKIGIDIGGSHIAIGVIDEDFRVIEKIEKRLLKNDKDDIQKTIEEFIKMTVNELDRKYIITEVGISVPGTVLNNVIIKSVNIGVENYDLVGRLSRSIKVPIKIRNDAKCAAIAECEGGSLKEYNNVLFLTIGTGIGGAVVINGKLLELGQFSGCEFGHLIIQREGVNCNCGKKGCFEKYASMKVLKDNLRKVLELDEKTTGMELIDIIKNSPENEEIKRIIEEFIEYLSIGISNLINIFEPDIVGIGGSFVFYEDILLDKLIKNILSKNYLFNKRDKLIIKSAILENDAGLIGSVL